ncbi:acetamidase regulatory protein [Cordyceps fumosorosea ARSEF 2679]|uniref:Acetamidase regulatory protein n=1 Tax=Cordyceps fumosorosea (strain ARSEF 2679) TaxID=1081104 RepID=A0A168CPP4_CORFA|nr:acetamidase regulatory protein [Cordyceps fumosorosea ARSEF 2679]OAA71638.1 acetamidase regulatory protein [Cordyceps fumosorosea ARSEF 2679]
MWRKGVPRMGEPACIATTARQVDCQVYQKKKTRSLAGAGAGAGAVVPIAPKGQAATAHDEEEQGNLVDLVYRQDLRHGEVGPLGRMCFVGSDVSNFSYIVRQVAPGHAAAFHFGSRQFHRRHTAHELQRVPPEALSRRSCAAALEARLLRAYFAHVNAGWPVVDEEHFSAQHSAGESPLPLVNAVLLVGARVLAARGEDTDAGGTSLKALQETLFRRTKTLLDCRFEQDRTMYVQVALLLTWYSDGHEEILANAWHWIGFAVRVALGHGMHRDATRSRMLPVHRRLWTRLWWILFQFDTAVSAAYGRPQALNLDESDVPELEPAHFQGIPNAQVDFAIQHAKLCAIFSAAMRARWALRSSTQARVAAPRRADEALAALITHLPTLLRLSPSLARGPPTPWTATLHLTYNNFALLLHRPPATDEDDAAATLCADPALCAGAAASMAGILHALCEGGGQASLWLYGVHAAFTALIHASGEMATAGTSPVLAARAGGTFGALMEALRCLARGWRFAENLLWLFRHKAGMMAMTQRDGTAATVQQPRPVAAAAAESFELRPPPVAPADVAMHGEESVSDEFVTPCGEEDDVLYRRDAEPLQHYGDGLHADGLMMDGYSDSFALDLFLAGMDGSTQDMSFGP